MGVMQSGYVFRSLTHTSWHFHIARREARQFPPGLPGRRCRGGRGGEAGEGRPQRPGRGGHRGRGGEAVVPVYRDGESEVRSGGQGSTQFSSRAPPALLPAAGEQAGLSQGLRDTMAKTHGCATTTL